MALIKGLIDASSGYEISNADGRYGIKASSANYLMTLNSDGSYINSPLYTDGTYVSSSIGLDVTGSILSSSFFRDQNGWMTTKSQSINLPVTNQLGGGFGGSVAPLSSGDMTTNDFVEFDASTNVANTVAYNGSVFDGRYLYQVPYGGASAHGRVIRYDTASSFSDRSSWTSYNASGTGNADNSTAVGYLGGSFDGRYVYYSPYWTGSTRYGNILRYDTKASFNSPSSYSVFDATKINPNAKGFYGMVFDGRYNYHVPNYTGTDYHGNILRYDTSGSFKDVASYSVFDATTLDTSARGFVGAIFDGKYIYYSPNRVTGTVLNGKVLRYNTHKDFLDASSYSIFDLGLMNPLARGYFGGTFDGRFVYLTPYYNAAYHGNVARYDTLKNFSDTTAWEIFNIAALGTGFEGAYFEGRYVYFVPYDSSNLVRYDTQQRFSDISSWSRYNVVRNSFTGINSDGRYLYLTQAQNYIIRFDTKTVLSSNYPSLDNLAVGENLYIDSSSGYVGLGTKTPQAKLDVQDTTNQLRLGYNDSTQVVFNADSFGSLNISSNNSQSNINVDRMSVSATLFRDQNGWMTTKSQSINLPVTNQLGGGFGGSVAPLSSGDMTANDFVEFDASTNVANTAGYYGSVFDGRYLYEVPTTTPTTAHGVVIRYDTASSFSDRSSWTSYNANGSGNADNSMAAGFVGGSFDGRYIYYSPNYVTGGLTLHGNILRYDTKAPFNSSSSYSVFDATMINPNAKGFYGVVFDGRYNYHVPYNLTNVVYHGNILRYDTSGSFKDVASYSVFNATTLDTSAQGFSGAIFDGKYIYYVPYIITNAIGNGKVLRYNTHKDFLDTSSYSQFDLSLMNTLAKGYRGGTFDGRFVYFTPYYNLSTAVYHGNVARYDTLKNFSDATAWEIFNIASLGVGFNTAYFEGRYVYLAPYDSSNLVRYDTQQRFSDISSWSRYNVVRSGMGALSSDGRFLYLTQNLTEQNYAIRFDTKTSKNYPSLDNLAVGKNLYIDSSSGWVDFGAKSPSAPVTIDSTNNPQLMIRYNDTTTGSLSVNNQGNLIISHTGSTAYLSTDMSIGRDVSIGRDLSIIGHVKTPVIIDSTVNPQLRIAYNDTTTGSLTVNSQGNLLVDYTGDSVYFSENVQVEGIIRDKNGWLDTNRLSMRRLNHSSEASLTIGLSRLEGGFQPDTVTDGLAYYSCCSNGRYVYYGGGYTWWNPGPQNYGAFLRYDTYKPFEAASYDCINTNVNGEVITVGMVATLITDSSNLYGATRYTEVTRVQNPGHIWKYNTRDPFVKNSFTVYDTSNNIDASCCGYWGAANDGSNLYFAPFGFDNAGMALKYNLKGDFTDASSWTKFDVSNLDGTGNAVGFSGACFDGKYVYFTPFSRGSLLRYDTSRGVFNDASSWQHFDCSNSLGVFNLEGAVYDGRYVYYLPGNIPPDLPPPSTNKKVLRYDTALDFTSVTSYTSFDIGMKASGGHFDGRYLHVAPARDYCNVKVYDTYQRFDSTSSWITVFGGIGGYWGICSDGVYIYVAPNNFDNSRSSLNKIMYRYKLTSVKENSWKNSAISDELFIGSSGVGIGTITPQAKLDVSGNARIGVGGYNTGHLLLGNYHFWVDSTGNLRINNGQPASDADGTVVGLQS